MMLSLRTIASVLAITVIPSLSLAAEGCPFLTNADIEEVTERQLLFELTTAELTDGPGTMCDSDIVRVILLRGEDAATRWDGYMRGAGRDEERRIPVTGLGDDTYALHLDPRAESEYATALMVVTSASYILAVSVRAKDGEVAASAESQALKLTKRAISKVQ